mmetsp:Transcript_84534/g.266831  ORF Transcript_84534/g.266831 Transcript_84534/m.266831 type:complete len:260 (-) Transcript_84534:661-1440(-)
MLAALSICKPSARLQQTAARVPSCQSKHMAVPASGGQDAAAAEDRRGHGPGLADRGRLREAAGHARALSEEPERPVDVDAQGVRGSGGDLHDPLQAVDQGRNYGGGCGEPRPAAKGRELAPAETPDAAELGEDEDVTLPDGDVSCRVPRRQDGGRLHGHRVDRPRGDQAGVAPDEDAAVARERHVEAEAARDLLQRGQAGSLLPSLRSFRQPFGEPRLPCRQTTRAEGLPVMQPEHGHGARGREADDVYRLGPGGAVSV